MLFCGLVIRLSGVDFVAEIAEMNWFSVKANRGTPSFPAFVEPDASIFGAGASLGIAGVSGVVGGSSGAEVGLAIVPAVMVDVVHVEVVRHVDDLAVHRYGQPLSELRRPLAPDGVVGAVAIAGVPFVPAEAVVVFGVHDGEFALREGDPAESVAVTQLSVPEHGQHGRPFQPARYPDFDDELDDFPRPLPPLRFRSCHAERSEASRLVTCKKRFFTTLRSVQNDIFLIFAVFLPRAKSCRPP
jgi:hypothetical protein